MVWAPGMTPATFVSPGLRTSTSWRSGSSASHPATSVAERRLAGEDSSGWAASADSTSGSSPMTASKPIRARRTLASSPRPASSTRTTCWPGRITSPAYSAKRPSRPTLIEPRRCPEANEPGRPGVDEDHPGPAERRVASPHRQAGRRLVVVEDLAVAAVGVGGEGEVEGGDPLALGDGGHEVVLRHRGQGVVGGPLLADGGRRRRREVLAAGRAGAVGGVDEGVVGQGEQLGVEGPVEVAGQARRRCGRRR